MHKCPENGMCLPTGRQLETVMYAFPPRHKDNKKKKKKNKETLLHKEAILTT